VLIRAAVGADDMADAGPFDIQQRVASQLT
jgi:hypothetical protein